MFAERHLVLSGNLQKGLGICGLYTFEIAESKAAQVLDKARKNQHPLQIKLEKE